MYRSGLLSVAAVLCLFLSGSPGQANRSVDDLIARLGAGAFAEREAASRALDELGVKALPALLKAQQSQDVEVRRRAAVLVEKIRARFDAARVLAPQEVRLSYKDTPLAEAVADLARKTGFNIRLEDPARLAGRKVTLEVGPTPFWNAFHAFCQKAGLKETSPAPAVKPQPARNGVSITIVGGGGGINRPPADIMKPSDKDQPGEIVLTEGAATDLPTHLAGKVRVKAMPPNTPVPDVTRQAGEALLALEVTPEPTLLWKDIIAVRVDKAIDEKGRDLVQRWISYKMPTPSSNASGGVIIVNGNVINPNAPPDRGSQRLAPVCLKLPPAPTKKLKELTGVISALVLPPEEPLVAIDDILGAAGKTFRGERAGFIRVVQGTHKDGLVKLKLDVEVPLRSLNQQNTPMIANILVNGQPLGGRDKTLSAANFALVDKKGKAFEVASAADTGRGNGVIQEIELTYRVDPGQQPFRFTYSDRRGCIVEVPFSFKNVNLE